MASPAAANPREQVWNASFETYYKTFFEELVADGLINRWGRLDDVTKILVALTASGSAVSGWALWTKPEWKLIWLACSGVAALLSIVHTALAVPGRIKAHADDKRRFSQLRIELETFRYRLEAEAFTADVFNKEYVDLHKKFGDNIGLLSSDTFRTRHFEESIQAHLNQQIANEIADEK
jgi:hypothetical protein